MKRILSFPLYTFLLLCNVVFSQIGVNTTDPERTLDVNGSLRVRDLNRYLNESNSNDYTQFLVANSGKSDASQKGNIDYLTLDDLRRLLKMPIGFKGTGGHTYVSTNEGKILEFPVRNLQLRVVGGGTNSFSRYYVQARLTSGTANIEVTEFAGDLGVTGGASGENKNLNTSWQNLADLSSTYSETGEIVIIFNDTAQTYRVLLATKDGGVGVRHYAFIAQELMD